MKYAIEINNKKYGLISRYAVPPFLEHDYTNSNFILYYPGGALEVFATDTCELCARNFKEATYDFIQVCDNRTVNHKLGYCARVCVDCCYYLEYIVNGNAAIPKTMKAVIDRGFVPSRLDLYL